MTTHESKSPTERMGIYKRLTDVPTEYRLSQYAANYEGWDVWAEWASEATEEHTSDRFAMYVERTERSWKSHMTERSRHHALATPTDVETWAATILQRCQPLSAYQIYFTKLEAFYTWLQYHPNHPHCYQPVWMAAAKGGETGRIWNTKIERSGF